ncbi:MULTISPECIES: universal stress protein [Halolamina]|uniref:Universal stress protein family protein n=1 Tax=Halolamina pelagica TaxID=699431 RepID=A0A1I5NJP5_9EURY|nr:MULTISPECIES: universal stress protein [Halolamina]NHX36350.1 universal stress protein [Halolamina sp. R1-12]SFP21999.1 Universal stress protein family protein [Halolamina pelagica]
MGEDGTALRNGRPVLGTLLDPTGDTQARELSFALAREGNRPVRLLSPGRTPDAQGSSTAAQADGPPVQFACTENAVRTGRSPAAVVAEEAAEASAAVVTVERPASESPGPGLRRETTDRIVANSPTDTVVANGCGELDDLASILVPVAGGPHTELTVRVARALAERENAWVELFTVVPADADADRRSAAAGHLAEARQYLGEFEEFDTWLYEADDPASAIAEQSAYYDAIVMGAPTKGRLKRVVFGSTPDSVDECVDIPVITATSK